MTPPGRQGRAFAVEDFVQSLTSQLDRAQDTLALKARAGRPLTFALKDINIDLRVFWEADPTGRLLMRHAGPNEEGASTVRLGFTTITRAMAEENSVALTADPDPRGLSDLRSTLDDDDRRKLELVGVRTVGQLRQMSSGADPKSMESYLGIPVLRLRSALDRASRPAVTSTEPVTRADGRKLLRIRGANLAGADAPEVRLSGEAVEVLEASDGELLVRPMSHHHEGQVEILLASGDRAQGFYEIAAAPAEMRRPVTTAKPLESEAK